MSDSHCLLALILFCSLLIILKGTHASPQSTYRFKFRSIHTCPWTKTQAAPKKFQAIDRQMPVSKVRKVWSKQNPCKIAQDPLWKEHIHLLRALTNSNSTSFIRVPEQYNRLPLKHPEHSEPLPVAFYAQTGSSVNTQTKSSEWFII